MTLFQMRPDPEAYGAAVQVEEPAHVRTTDPSADQVSSADEAWFVL